MSASLLASIDQEIARLQQAKAALLDGTTTRKAKPRAKKAASAPTVKRRKLSAEGRARIVAAVKKRWALQKKAAKVAKAAA